MTKCRKKMPLSTSGDDRGYCSKPVRHRSKCNNNTCRVCAVRLTNKNSYPSGVTVRLCRICERMLSRTRRGQKPRNIQRPRKFHRFICGCSGILPNLGKQNRFATHNSKSTGVGFACRAGALLSTSKHVARRNGYKPINQMTPHSAIRRAMDSDVCVLCGATLQWKFGLGKTPHLHHDHETGELIGFAHPTCNMPEAKTRMKQLLQENIKLRRRILECEQAA